ncbi:MAG: YncE family protein [Alphaproteobacteria bacterium]
MKTYWAVLALWCTLALAPTAGAALVETVIQVPGFADFLAIDGTTVWATNKGRVERWSRAGKLAEVPLDGACGAMTISKGALWVADCKAKTVNRIDIRTDTVVAVIATGLASPDGEMNIVSGAGSIWVASDKSGVIARIDPATNKVIVSIKVEPGACYLAFGEGALWAVSAEKQTIQKIDPSSNLAVLTTKLGKAPGFLTVGEGGIWVQEQGDGTLVRLDPATGTITGRVKIDETLKWGDIDTGGGKVWLRTTAGQTFVVLDPKSLAILARIGNPVGSGALRYTPNGIWTSAHDVHTLSWWADAAAMGK